MLKIRLARGGKHKAAFFRVVVTEHTKPAKSGFKEVLGFHDPIKHETKIDIEKANELIKKGVQPTPKVAKLMYAISKDESLKKFMPVVNRERKVRNPKED